MSFWDGVQVTVGAVSFVLATAILLIWLWFWRDQRRLRPEGFDEREFRRLAREVFGVRGAIVLTWFAYPWQTPGSEWVTFGSVTTYFSRRGRPRHAISIAVLDRTREQLLEYLVHELVHAWQSERRGPEEARRETVRQKEMPYFSRPDEIEARVHARQKWSLLAPALPEAR